MSKRTRLLGRLKHVYSHNAKLVLDVSNDDIGLIIEGVEKQVAKKVTVEGVYDYWGDEVDNEYTCPTCLKEDYVHYRDIKYCWNCGQKLDLSEVE